MPSGCSLPCGPRRESSAGILLLMAVTGCGAGWHQPPHLQPGPLAPHQQVQVWHAGAVEQWYAVEVTADSFSGIPISSPQSCDSCRHRMARSAVDSVRLGNPLAGFVKTAGLVVAIPWLAIGVACGFHQHCL